MRDHYDQNLGVFVLRGVVRAEISKDRYVGDPRQPADVFRLRPFNQTAENIDLAIHQADVVFDFFGADHRLIDAANTLRARHRGDFHRQLHADLVIGVDARRHVHDHAHIQILELRIHQGIYDARRPCRSHADTRLEAARGHRNAITDAQFGILPIHDADLRVVDDACGAVGKQRGGGDAGQSEAVVVGENMRIF